MVRSNKEARKRLTEFVRQICCQDRSKTNQNENFSKMEKIQKTYQNEKFSKMEKIQKFAK